METITDNWKSNHNVIIKASDGIEHNIVIPNEFTEKVNSTLNRLYEAAKAKLNNNSLIANDLIGEVLYDNCFNYSERINLITNTYFNFKSNNTSSRILNETYVVEPLIISLGDLNNNLVEKEKDVFPLSIVTEVFDGSAIPMIKSGASISEKGTDLYTTCFDNQTEVLIKYYEGNRKLAVHNKLLASFRVKINQPKKKGEVKINESVELIDGNMLKITVEIDGSEPEIKWVSYNPNNISNEDARSKIEDAENNLEHDNEIIKHINSLNHIIDTANDHKSVEGIKELLSKMYEYKNDLKRNPNIKGIPKTIEEFKERCDSLIE